jgi:hypothetical protein
MATLKNTTINDTGHLTFPSGTTAERPASPVVGMVRYNTTLSVLEQYTATGWQGIEAPPIVSGVSGQINVDTNTTLTISGSNFKSGSLVYIEGAGVGNVSRGLSTTFVSSTSLTAATNAASVNYTGGSSYDVKVVNPSGLSASLLAAGTVDRDPVWSTAAGSLGTVYDSLRTGQSFTVTATDPDSNTVTYSVVSGAVPTGMSFNTSTGVISGTVSAVGTDTTYSFTVRASSTNNSLTSDVDRAFSILVKAPVVTSFTSTGSATFNVPTGISSVQVLVVAAGGGGGGANGFEVGGGGGAGGYIYTAAQPVTPGGTVPVTVGAGGTGAPQQSTQPPNSSPSIPVGKGGNSAFGPITATGGGIGGGQYWNGQPGGSGGGEAGNISGPVGGTGTSGQGNPGGAGTNNAAESLSGGGGGASAAGGSGSGSTSGSGGAGTASSITGTSVTYAGGGGGAGKYSGGGTAGSGGAGGGGAGSLTGSSSTPGTTNRGGGGGGGSATPSGTTAGNGGPGIVIVRY